MASLKYDPSAKALYFKVTSGKVAQTEPVNDGVFIDLDKKGELVGIEFILPKDFGEQICTRNER